MYLVCVEIVEIKVRPTVTHRLIFADIFGLKELFNLEAETGDLDEIS